MTTTFSPQKKRDKLPIRSSTQNGGEGPRGELGLALGVDMKNVKEMCSVCIWKKTGMWFKVNKCSVSPCFRPVINITKPKVESRAAISLTLTPAAEQLPRHQAKKKGGPARAEDSDTDAEAPVAQQMLSFVMDDPDFESEASDTPKITKVKQKKLTEVNSLHSLFLT